MGEHSKYRDAFSTYFETSYHGCLECSFVRAYKPPANMPSINLRGLRNMKQLKAWLAPGEAIELCERGPRYWTNSSGEGRFGEEVA